MNRNCVLLVDLGVQRSGLSSAKKAVQLRQASAGFGSGRGTPASGTQWEELRQANGAEFTVQENHPAAWHAQALSCLLVLTERGRTPDDCRFFSRPRELLERPTEERRHREARPAKERSLF